MTQRCMAPLDRAAPLAPQVKEDGVAVVAATVVVEMAVPEGVKGVQGTLPR